MIDLMNRRMGSATIKSAGEGIEQRWKMKAGNKSPGYTTRWKELAVANA